MAGKNELFRDDPDCKNAHHAACLGTLRAIERLFGYKCTKPNTSYELRYAPTPLLHMAVLDIVQKLRNKSFARPAFGLEIIEAITRLIASRQPMAAAPVPMQSRPDVEKAILKLYKKLPKEDYGKAPEKQKTEAGMKAKKLINLLEMYNPNAVSKDKATVVMDRVLHKLIRLVEKLSSGMVSTEAINLLDAHLTH